MCVMTLSPGSTPNSAATPLVLFTTHPMFRSSTAGSYSTKFFSGVMPVFITNLSERFGQILAAYDVLEIVKEHKMTIQQ